jgi:hypothetical protein
MQQRRECSGDVCAELLRQGNHVLAGHHQRHRCGLGGVLMIQAKETDLPPEFDS